MVQAQDSAQILVILPDSSQPAWLEALSGGYHLHVAALDDALPQLAQETPAAVLVAESCPNCADVLACAKQITPPPVLVLLADSPASAGCDHLADVIAAPDARLLPRQLHQALAVQTARAQADEQIHLAWEHAAAADARLEEHRKSARELELLKNTIVNNVSHELKTPLLHVKAAVALLAEDAANPKLAEYATGATARLEAVVRNITQLAGSQDLNIGPLLIRECITYAITNLGRTWEHKEAVGRIQIAVDDHLPPVLGDRQGISTVIQLLLDNGLKFSQDTVTVSAHLSADAVHVSVSDHGIGIAPDQREQIFDSFYQIDGSSTRPYGGTGIGLAIVRLILDRHHVRIKVDSKLGKGSVFSFSLPLADL
jgi:signal transduction histidine kinase